MEFGKHIGKGLWAFADKALPALYGLAYIFIVVRVLPEHEFGVWGDIQALFLLLSALCTTLTFLPLTKFASERDDYGEFVIVSLFVGFVFYAIASAGLLVFKDTLIPLLDRERSESLYNLWNYVPLLLFATLFRSLVLSILQARYAVQKIFWIDAVYFLGTIAMIVTARHVNRFSTASDLVVLKLVGYSASTLLSLLFLIGSLPAQLTFRWKNVVRLFQFGKYLFGANAIYAVFSQFDVFFVSSYGGFVAVATYNVAKIFNRIFDMLSQVLQMFLLPYSSKAVAKGDTTALLTTAEKAICFSLLLLLPVFLAMLLVPEWILQLLYHGRYQDAAPLMRIFAFLALIVPWNGVTSNYLVGLGKVKQGFYLGFVLFILALLFYAMLTPSYGAMGTATGYVAALGVTTMILYLYTKKFIPLRVFNVLLRVKDVGAFVKKKLS